jgi:uncharacterized protein YukE
MSFEGMDVDQLTALAKQIDSAAQALYNLVTSLTGTMGGLTLLWHGPVAATFEQDWESKNRPALLAAYNTLTNLHTTWSTTSTSRRPRVPPMAASCPGSMAASCPRLPAMRMICGATGRKSRTRQRLFISFQMKSTS